MCFDLKRNYIPPSFLITNPINAPTVIIETTTAMAGLSNPITDNITDNKDATNPPETN